MNATNVSLKYRQTVLHSGHRSDLVKSNLQKSIRLGNTSEAQRCFAALVTPLDLPALDEKEQRIAKSLRTNVINRVIVCAAEDIGLGDLGRVKAVIDALQPMTKSGKRQEFDLERCLGAVALLSESVKSRTTSHLFHVVQACNSELAAENGFAVVRIRPESVPLCSLNTFQAIGDKASEATLWSRLQNTQELDQPFLSSLYTAYQQQSEKRPFMQLALAYAHYALSIDPRYTEYFRQCLLECPPFPSSEPSFLGHLRLNQTEITILDQAVDVHTFQGRQNHATCREFREQGSVVYPEAELFHKPELMNVYINSKYVKQKK